MKREAYIKIISSLFTLLWVYAAISKLAIYPAYRIQMLLQPLPGWSKGIITIALPVIELGLTILLLNSHLRKWGLILSTLLMLAFTGYIALALSHSLKDVPCSCGGIISHFSWRQHLWFNIAWLALGIIGMMLNTKRARANIRKTTLRTQHI